ncbi:MAG: peptide ABC transporter substrate-binding protein [Candidatus Promineifilaceae bacterium]|jgi:ABC-type oligopeptide transport system substrate-binding subunit
MVKFRSGHIFTIIILLFVFALLGACQPQEPEMVVVTEVVHLGEEQIIITRLVELLPTETPTAPPPAVEPEPVALDIAYEESLPDLDPQHIGGQASLDMAESLFAGLTNFNHKTQQVEPELAASWTVGSDGRTWTFALRDDIYWVKPINTTIQTELNAAPERVRLVDAQDVVFALQRACTSENAVPDAFLLFMIEGCETLFNSIEPGDAEINQLAVSALDDRTVQITLVEPASDFLTLTTLPQFRPVPRELVEEFEDEWLDAAEELSDGWQTPENIMVNGPFVPSASPFNAEEMVLIRNRDWPIIAGGNADKINVTFQMDEMDMFAAWQDRKLDISQLPPEERDDFLDSSPDKAQLITNQTVFYIGFNFDSAVFREVQIRRAFSSALDRSSLVESMFDGRALELRHFTPPGVFGAPATNEVGVGYSPDFALQQMDKSSIRSCKLIPPVTMLVSTADLSLLQGELIRNMWISELDCDEQLITIEQVDFGELLARTSADAESGRPDMWELAWPAYYPDANNFLGDLLNCTDGENRQNRQCSVEDGLMRQARISTDPQERSDLYREVEKGFFNEDGSFPLIPLYVRGNYVLVQSWLKFPAAYSGGQQFDTYIVDQELKRLERSRG